MRQLAATAYVRDKSLPPGVLDRIGMWVEPLHDWGEGAVQLVELPTNDETEDNIVAMWVPKQPVKAGSSLRYRYRLQWCAAEPHPTALARCVATRLGRGGEPGKERPKGVHKFMVEFLGGPLASLPFGVKPKPILWVIIGRVLLCFHGGRSRWHTGTLAGPIRFHRGRTQRRRHAAVSQERRTDALRNLALSVPHRVTRPLLLPTAAGQGGGDAEADEHPTGEVTFPP
jgi:hypothetical protein